MSRFARVPCPVLLAVLTMAGLVVLATLPDPSGGAPAPAPRLDESLKKARCDGTYRMLLRQIAVPGDADKHGPFEDAGFRDVNTYAGHKDLPAGWWVYVAPYWYIWRDLAASRRVPRNWGPEQATGKPSVTAAGDSVNAWCPKLADDDEWLLLEYAEPVVPTAILVHENYNPGALVRVTAFKLDGTEVQVWRGKDPTAAGSGSGISEIPVRIAFKTNRVKLYLDSKSVPDWQEIDAVGIRDRAKKMHWAVAAEASSTYAQPYPEDKDAALLDRIRRLEAEVKRLNKVIEEMKRKEMKK